MEEYLDGGYLCPVNDAFQSRAEEIVGDRDEASAARELHRFVRDNYAMDMGKIRGATYVLENNPSRVMSMDKSNLLVSLLRSIEIPARFYFMQCEMYNAYKDRVDDSFHAPVEVKVDGEWATADPAYGIQTEKFRSPAEFGEETWTSIKNAERMHSLPRKIVLGYNYFFRIFHPDVRKIRKELRECQEI